MAVVVMTERGVVAVAAVVVATVGLVALEVEAVVAATEALRLR